MLRLATGLPDSLAPSNQAPGCRLICQKTVLFGDTKSLSGTPTGSFAGVLYCLIVLLLRCSDIEVYRLLCLPCARALKSHIHGTFDKTQPVVHEVQAMAGLRSHAMLDTSRPRCCMCRHYLIQSLRKHVCRSTLVCQNASATSCLMLWVVCLLAECLVRLHCCNGVLTLKLFD